MLYDKVCRVKGHSKTKDLRGTTVKEKDTYKVVKYEDTCRRCGELLNERREVVWAHDEEPDNDPDTVSWDGSYMWHGNNSAHTVYGTW